MPFNPRSRRPEPAIPHEPTAHNRAAARSLAAVDRVLTEAAGQPVRCWPHIDQALDERLALTRIRPAVPVIPGPS